MRNMTLNSNDHIYKLIKDEKPRKVVYCKALPQWKQKVFTDLHSLSGIDYQIKLKELGLNITL